MTSRERRAHERAPVRLPVRVRTAAGGEFDGVIENLGLLGALVSTADLETPIDVGDRLRLEFSRSGAGGPRLEIEGVAVRLEQEFAGGEIRRSFALRFTSPLP